MRFITPSLLLITVSMLFAIAITPVHSWRVPHSTTTAAAVALVVFSDVITASDNCFEVKSVVALEIICLFGSFGEVSASTFSSIFNKPKPFVIMGSTAFLFSYAPNEVEAVGSPCAKEVSCGGSHCCVRTWDSGAKCWGNGEYGRLGLGSLVNGSNPNWGDEQSELANGLPFIDFGSNVTVVQISVGGSFTCALLSDATLKCVGHNE